MVSQISQLSLYICPLWLDQLMIANGTQHFVFPCKGLQRFNIRQLVKARSTFSNYNEGSESTHQLLFSSICRCRIMVIPQTSNLMPWVRFPSSALCSRLLINQLKAHPIAPSPRWSKAHDFDSRIIGSNPNGVVKSGESYLGFRNLTILG